MANLDRTGNKNSSIEPQPNRPTRSSRALTAPARRLLLLNNTMKTNRSAAWAFSVAVGLVFWTARAEEAAVVKKDRVNVRAQASQRSEIITQLKKGETVAVLEEITPKKRKRGEPASWAKIQLPSNTPVWVYAPYIETTNHTVNIKRLNLRAGPGENFSVIGRLDRGTEVKEIRTEGNWMEIEAPANAYAFVAADMLEKSGIAPA